MKKINVSALQEIKASDIVRQQGYLEDAIKLFTGGLLAVSDGVIQGMNVTQNGASGLVCSTGSIFQSGVFGELEASSGITVPLPGSGTRSDLVVAYYQEVNDTSSTGYVLLDVDTRQETTQTFSWRKFGAARVELLQNTPVSGCPANRILLAQVNTATSGITSVATNVKDNADYRQRYTLEFSNITNLKAYTSHIDKDVAYVLDVGYFLYDSTSAVLADDLFVVSPNTAVGRWLMMAPHINTVYDYLMDEINGIAAKQLTSFIVYDAPSIAANTGLASPPTVTVTGASPGDAVSVGLPTTHNTGVHVSGLVSSANTVTLNFRNFTAAAIDLASGTYQVTVLKY